MGVSLSHSGCISGISRFHWSLDIVQVWFSGCGLYAAVSRWVFMSVFNQHQTFQRFSNDEAAFNLLLSQFHSACVLSGTGRSTVAETVQEYLINKYLFI